ncbi:MAG: hypothetical protein AAGH90_05535 [Pseudomonadota bacterium]
MGNGNKVEFFVAICALFSSLIAIWVAWDQSRVMRAQQDGMVFPVLQLDGFVSTEAETISLGLRLENSGVGPALIESVQIVDDKEYVTSLAPYRAILPEGFTISWAGLIGRAVAPGSGFDVLRLQWDSDEITRQELNAAAFEWGELDFEICYCSVFQKCWIETMSITRAQSVETCPKVSETDVFEEFGLSQVSTPTPASEEVSE